MQDILFYISAALTLVCGALIILNRNPVNSAMFLVLSIASMAGLFVLLHAFFLAAIQVLVYAGAVMVLFLFVVALLGPTRERTSHRLRFQWGLSILVAVVFGAFVYAQLQGIGFRAPDKLDMTVFGTVEQIGIGLFTTYLYPFELTSILLLVAAVGAIYLSRGGRTASEIRRQEEEEDNVA